MNKNTSKKIIICQLYPTEMNIYGDSGNALALSWRAKQYGFSPEIISHNVGDNPEKTFLRADILLGGGGQDSGQKKILQDLQKNGAKLKKMARGGTPMIMICGMYQLFGNFFQTVDNKKMHGIGLFNTKTIGGKKRLTGNVVSATEFGVLVGYENHSGKTILDSKDQKFGAVIFGSGNNNQDSVEISLNQKHISVLGTAKHNSTTITGSSEGARIYNIFGSYLHGPILPKNITLTDEILRIVAEKKFGNKKLIPKSEKAKRYLRAANQLAKEARTIAIQRAVE